MNYKLYLLAAASIAAAALPEAFSGVPPAAPAPRGVPSPGGGIPPCCSSDLVNAPDPRAARGSSGPQSWEKARCPCVGSRPWRRAEVRPRILKNERTNHSSASVELNQNLLQTDAGVPFIERRSPGVPAFLRPFHLRVWWVWCGVPLFPVPIATNKRLSLLQQVCTTNAGIFSAS